MHRMLSVRLSLVCFTFLALGCSGKKEDPAPTPAPLVDITGRWDLTTQVITDYRADGSPIASNTYHYDNALSGQDWTYLFKADKTFEYIFQDQILISGTYTNTNTTLVKTNLQGGATPTNTSAIEKATATELVFLVGAITSGRTSRQSFVKH